MKKNKEEARQDYITMVGESWTFDRLTGVEKIKIAGILRNAKIKGTYKQRWEQLGELYAAFLDGLGYAPIGWREPVTDKPRPLF